jgi:hypothetical protein
MQRGKSAIVLRHLPIIACPVVLFLFATAAAAQPIVLSGYATTFTKANGANPSLPDNQDRITSNVAITRGTSGGGIYNALAESGFPVMDPNAISPKFTQWATDINNPDATIAATNWEELAFDTWVNAYGGLMGAGPNTEDRDAVLRIIRGDIGLDDIYLDIRFTDWISGGSGGFTYERASTPTGDYNGDAFVDAADYVAWRDTESQAVTPGSGADGNLSRVIDAGDYDHWRSRFGNMIPAGAVSSKLAAAPEPSIRALLVCGLLLVVIMRRRFPAGQASN